MLNVIMASEVYWMQFELFKLQKKVWGDLKQFWTQDTYIAEHFTTWTI